MTNTRPFEMSQIPHQAPREFVLLDQQQFDPSSLNSKPFIPFKEFTANVPDMQYGQNMPNQDFTGSNTST